MRVLVTGGAGYIGCMLVPMLLKEGYQVTILDNFSFGNAGLSPYCLNPDLKVVRGDSRDSKILKDLVDTHDAFIPLAGIVGAHSCDADTVAAETVNTGAVRTLCDLLSPSQIVVLPNTNSGYGTGGELYCTEESPLKPISLYGRTKVAAEAIVLERYNSLTLRLATVFGCSPRMRTDLLVNNFVKRAIFDRAIVVYQPRFRRNYCHVVDVSRAFIHALANFSEMRGEAYNCGDTSANMSKGDLCEKIKQHVPGFVWLEGPGEDIDKRDYIVANDKLEATGWHPSVTLDQGIDELIKYYEMAGNVSYGND